MSNLYEDEDEDVVETSPVWRWAALIAAAVFGAVVVAMLVVAVPSKASAADKSAGGECCADLEERIAELEATTARKGNRKVSLTVSGWVAEQAVWWDDGTESDVYVGGVGRTIASHFKFTGQATISPGWYAGYVLQLEAVDNDPLAWNQDGTGASGVEVLQTVWFVKSDKLGKVSVGKQSTAADNAAITVDGSGSLIPADWVLFDGAGFFLRANGVRIDQALANLGSATWGPATITGGLATDRGLTWGNQLGYCNSGNAGLGGDCAGVPLQAVRYDTPTFKGFSASASWAEGDYWDAAVRYTGEIEGFKLAGAVAYSHTDGTAESNYAQAGVYVEHVATGIFLYGAYGHEENSGFNVVGGNILLSATLPGPIVIGPIGIPVATIAPAGDSSNWYVKGGVRERWVPLGHTVLYAEYGQHDDQLGPELRLIGATDSKLTQYGLGVVQELDAAAMSVWLKYRHMDGEASGGGTTIDFDGIDFVGAGALINF